MMLLIAGAGCGENTPMVVGPDPAVAPFVGTWDAEVFRVTSSADTSVVADLLIQGSFVINIQPSGLYTATLIFANIPNPVVEIGQLTVATSLVTLAPTGGTDCPGSSVFSFAAADYFSMTGPTCFDFNLDGESEDAEAHIELRRRP